MTELDLGIGPVEAFVIETATAATGDVFSATVVEGRPYTGYGVTRRQPFQDCDWIERVRKAASAETAALAEVQPDPLSGRRGLRLVSGRDQHPAFLGEAVTVDGA